MNDMAITVLAGQAGFLVVSVLLLKSAVRVFSSKEMDRVSSDLKAQAERELATLKRAADRDESLRNSVIIARKADVIAEFYGHLSEIERALRNFTDLLEAQGEQNAQGKYRQAMQKTIDFFWFFDKHRLYLNPALAVEIEAFAETLRRATVEVTNFFSSDEADPELLQEREETLRTALRHAAEEVPRVREALEEEFQSLAG